MYEAQDHTLLILGNTGICREASVFKIRGANNTSAYFGEELVVEDLIQGESVTGVFLQDSWDEFLCSRGKRWRQMVPDFLYALIRLFQVQSLKRWISTHQRVPTREKPEAQNKKNDSKAQKDSTGCHNVQADVTKWPRSFGNSHLCIPHVSNMILHTWLDMSLTWRIQGTKRQTLCRGPAGWGPPGPDNLECRRLFWKYMVRKRWDLTFWNDADRFPALLMHYADKAEVADTFFFPSRTFLCIPQRGVIQVLKLCLGRCIQLPLENRFSEVLTAGSWWEEVYAVEPMWWLRVTGRYILFGFKVWESNIKECMS